MRPQRACAGGAIPEAPHSGHTDTTWKETSSSSLHTFHTAVCTSISLLPSGKPLRGWEKIGLFSKPLASSMGSAHTLCSLKVTN